MQLLNEQIQEFKRIYKQLYNIALSDDEAREKG